MEPQTAPCDLHLHSTYSDGTMPPEELVSYARAIGLSAVSITDHDTVNAQAEALAAGERCGIDVVTGIEFSIEEDGANIHILGYCFDHENRALAASLEELAASRVTRAEEIVRKLEERGVSIAFEEVLAEAGSGCVGRPHIARVLKRRGHVSSISEAFARYISDSAPCHVAKKVLPGGHTAHLARGRRRRMGASRMEYQENGTGRAAHRLRRARRRGLAPESHGADAQGYPGSRA
jgi:predicted metal-dependent phosphoesterase TrpH